MKLTQQRLEQAAKAIAMGATVALAAKAIGIDRRTWYRWRERGQRGIHPYTDFLAAVDAADAECAHRNLALIDQAAQDGSWQAAAWMLERRHGYTRTPAPIIQAEPKTIDITTTEGQVAALEILNQIPVTLVAQMNRKRLEAALQTPVEPNQQPKHQLEERWENGNQEPSQWAP